MHHGNAPLYRDLRKELQARIADGRYPKGAPIPRELDLCVEFNVSRNTVRAALAELAAQGMVRRVKKLGTLVESTRPRSAYAMDMGAMAGLRRYVQTTRLTVLRRTLASLPDALVQIVGARYAKGWLLMRAVRHHGTDGPPVAGMDFYLREAYAAVADHYGKTEGMLYEVLESKFKVCVERFDVKIRATTVGARWAETLEASRSTPALNMVETVWTDTDELLEVGSMVIPQDRMHLAYSVPPPRWRASA